MPKFTLICDHSYDQDTHVVTHEFNAEYLGDVVDNIDMFLRGAGFHYQGELAIVQEQHSNFYFDTERNR